MSETGVDIAKIAAKNRLEEPVFVTRTRLPDFERFQEHLRPIWKSHWVTNNGDIHARFERKLGERLGLRHVSLTCNGTLALMIAVRALGLKGEVITTPFTFPATPSSLVWNGINPVFCDIAPGTFHIDPDRIEEAVTPMTTAVLAVHVYGNPCDVEGIDRVAEKYGLKVLYDAAHAIAVKYRGVPLSEFGNASIFSFHASKLFHTFEGGALVTSDEDLKRQADYLRNFGIADEETVLMPGINAKMNELQAAIGLLGLELMDEEIAARKNLFLRYNALLKGLPGITCPATGRDVDYNYMYYPVLVDKAASGLSRDALHDTLKACNIFGRKYFYPLASEYPFFSKLESSAPERLGHARRAADSVLCLPLYGELESEKVETVCFIIKEALRSA